jgi:hypothetical protein
MGARSTACQLDHCIFVNASLQQKATKSLPAKEDVAHASWFANATYAVWCKTHAFDTDANMISSEHLPQQVVPAHDPRQ